MNESMGMFFDSFSETLIGYMPKLLAGVVLLIIGWILGWFAKRVTIQVCVLLRLERFVNRFSWGRDFSRADIRLGVYNVIGNAAFLLVFFALVSVALESMQMASLSHLIQQGVLIIPKLIILTLIIGMGWVFSSWIAKGIQRTLVAEQLPRPTFLAWLVKCVVRVFFTAMALVNFGMARVIVIIGFSVVAVVVTFMASLLGYVFVKERLRIERPSDEESEV